MKKKLSVLRTIIVVAYLFPYGINSSMIIHAQDIDQRIQHVGKNNQETNNLHNKQNISDEESSSTTESTFRTEESNSTTESTFRTEESNSTTESTFRTEESSSTTESTFRTKESSSIDELTDGLISSDEPGTSEISKNSIKNDKNLKLNEFNWPDWEYTLDNSKKIVTLTKYIGTNPDILVPSEYNGYKVQLNWNKDTFPENITSVVTTGTDRILYTSLGSLSSLFQDHKKLKKVDLNKLKLENGIGLMSQMFWGCSSLVEVDINDMDISEANIHGTWSMFRDCISLKRLDLSNLNFKHVTNATHMFENTPLLKILNISNWVANDNLDTENMFKMPETKSLIVLYNSEKAPQFGNYNFKDSNCTNLYPLIDGNGGKFSNGQSTLSYFDSCAVSSTSPKLELNTFNKWLKENQPTKEESTFRDWEINGINGDPTTIYDLLNATYTAKWFSWSDWKYTLDNDKKTVTLINYTGTNPNIVVPSEYDGYKVVIGWYRHTFNSVMNSLQSIQFKDKEAKVPVISTDWTRMLRSSKKLEYVDLTGIGDTSTIKSLNRTFWDCPNLKKVNLSGFNSSNVNDMEKMFSDDPKLTVLNLSNFNTKNVTNMQGMFFTKEQTSLLVTYNSQNGNKLAEYNYSLDNRNLNYPMLDGNGGKFSNGQKTLSYFDYCAVSSTSPKLELNTFNKWLKENQPTKEESTFRDWEINGINGDPTTIYDLLNATYTAQWEIYENPNTSLDNKKINNTKGTSIVYIPNNFNADTNILKNIGEQSILIKKQETYNIGVRSKNGEAWQLRANLTWNGRPLLGAELKTTNTKGIVKQNINNGQSEYDPSKDLIENPSSPLGVKSVVIGSDESVIMIDDGTSKDGVYDYDLGDTFLSLKDTSQVAAGEYKGNINWNLYLIP